MSVRFRYYSCIPCTLLRMDRCGTVGANTPPGKVMRPETAQDVSCLHNTCMCVRADRSCVGLSTSCACDCKDCRLAYLCTETDHSRTLTSDYCEDCASGL